MKGDLLNQYPKWRTGPDGRPQIQAEEDGAWTTVADTEVKPRWHWEKFPRASKLTEALNEKEPLDFRIVLESGDIFCLFYLK